MSIDDIAVALGAGATLVTPNKRLARHLIARFDAAQQAAGQRTWASGRAMPWQVWLQSLMRDALAAGAMPEPRTLIAESTAAHLWDRVVAQASPDLFDTGGAAVQAAEAWALFHAWRRPGDAFDGWSRAGIGDAAAAFATWAQRYRSELAQRGLLDIAQVADRLAAIATRVPAWRQRDIVTIGFIEFSPQQQRLLEALRESGAAVAVHPFPRAGATRRHRVTCATPAAELGAALAWAREHAIANPEADIGVVVEDLAQRRDDVAARAEDILCPELASRVLPDARRPYDISFGAPLAEVPVVTAALDMIALGAGELTATDAAVLVRGAYLPDAQARWSARAAVERGWQELGTRTVHWQDILRALRHADPTLAERWRALSPPGNAMRSPARWATDWRTWLDALGWPGNHALGSGEWQACESWSRLLAEFGSLATVAPTLSRDAALAALRAVAARTVFQPESPDARIRILGVLEASGLEFDALWVAGLTAERWPPAPAPHPMLPLAWQRERRVPRADTGSDVAHARAMTEGFGAAAHTVVASHANIVDGLARAGTALTAAWPPYDAVLPQPAGLAQAIAAQRADVASCADDRAPPLPIGTSIRGGVSVVESQSTCPFQAFARHRLRSDAWREPSEGLTPMERGTLLHAALAAFWDGTHDHATLRALSERDLNSRIADAVEHAGTRLDRARWQALPAVVARGEPQRLADTLRVWLDVIERERPPFAVRDVELKLPLALGGIGLSLRIDRIDTLADGGVAVIDYKGGRAIEPGKWFAARPSGTQLGQYALALRAQPEPPMLRAAIYAQLKPGEIAIQGVAEDAGTWPPAKTPSAMRGVPFATWPELEADWETRLSALAEEFRSGIAAVAPRDGQCCKRCELQPLCRIQTLSDKPAATDDSADV